MYQPMSPCPACTRHIRVTEGACPFCGASLPAEFAGQIAPDTTRRLGRAAAYTFGAVLAVTGCGASTSPAPPPPTDTGVTLDNGAVTDTGTLTDQGTPPTDTVIEDRGGLAPPYGIPPKDAGLVDDTGGPVAEYGAPPPPRDAGPDDAGTFKADYGAPPPRDAGR